MAVKHTGIANRAVAKSKWNMIHMQAIKKF